MPQFVLKQMQAHLAAANLAISYERAHFDPTGKVLLEAVRVRVLPHTDPVLVAHSAYVHKGIWAILSGSPIPEEIRLDGATLQLPAPLSPTGIAAPLLRDGAVTVRIEGALLHIDQLTFRVGNLTVTAQGDFHLPPTPSGAATNFAASLTKFLLNGRLMLRQIEALQAFEHPSLAARLEFVPGIGNLAEITFFADAVQRPFGEALTLGTMTASTTVRLDVTEKRPVRTLLEFASLDYRSTVVAGRTAAVVATELSADLGAWPAAVSLRLAASRVDGWEQSLLAPVLALEWEKTGSVTATLATMVHDEIFGFEAKADLGTERAEIAFDGAVSPTLVKATLPVYAPRLAPYFRFGDPVTVHAQAEFGPAWKFRELHARVRGGHLDSNGVKVTSTRGTITVDAAGNFLAEDAFVTAGQNYASGSYWMNFSSLDFRMLLRGGLQPPTIAGWFRSDWWLDFWERIQFPGLLPVADVALEGNWRQTAGITYFGSTEATEAVVLGVDFAKARTRIFLRPHFAHIFDLQASRANGSQNAAGWFKRVADAESRDLSALVFDLAGNLDAFALERLGGATARTLLQPWQFEQAPALSLAGQIDFPNGLAVPKLSFRGHASGKLSYAGFPIESVTTSGKVSGDKVRLDQIELQALGGIGTAKADLSGAGEAQQLGFDFYLKDADLAHTITALNNWEKAEVNSAPANDTNNKMLQRATGGRLNFALSAQGHPGALASFLGSGNLEVTRADLGEIHLFGLLSQVLSGLSLNFSSLKLDTMRGSFHLADGNATFSDLRVTGPSAAIEGKGTYRLIEKDLNFTARLRPYESSRGLITGLVGIVVNPLASIIELRLVGPVRKPAWSFSLGSSTTRDAPKNQPDPPPATSPESGLPAKPAQKPTH
ncbi:MAG: AsmA-like C-terminal region-containing protein [Candidatus Didemnitutus sp.]|nr:AsmA-like C-terminal region-containing protein [Candidatus Didemnitutus sp.]